jgi:MerR family transcriptional regulator/heat shock protein HspR
MAHEGEFRDEPCFVISIAARMVGLNAQTLRYYERVGLIWPSRSIGRQRLYSPTDIDRLRRIKTFTDEMGMNLAGAEVALKLVERIEELETEVKKLNDQVRRLQKHAQTETR